MCKTNRVVSAFECGLIFFAFIFVDSIAASQEQDIEAHTHAIGIKGTDEPFVGGSGNLSCYEYKSYFALVRISLQGEMVKGSDILIRAKKEEHQQIQCDYVAKQGDFEIKAVLGQTFGGIKSDLLLVDTAIGPNQERLLTLYDLVLQKRLYETNYVEPVVISQSGLSFWRLKRFANSEDCASASKSAGLRSTIEVSVVFDIHSLRERETGAIRCGALE